MLTRCKIFFLLGLILLGGCKVLPKFPRIARIDSLRIEHNNDLMLRCRIDSRIYNPNVFPFTVEQMRYWAYVDFYELGGGRIEGPVRFPAHETTGLKNQPVYILYQNFETILQKQSQLDSVPVTFLIKARLDIVPLLPVYYAKTLWLKPADFLRAAINPENIQRLIEIKDLRLSDVDIFKSKLEGEIILKNDFPLNYTIDSLCLNIYDRYNQKTGSIRICDIPVAEFSHEKIPFTVQVDNVLMAVSLLGQYIEEDIRYRAEGQLHLTINGENFSVPVNEQIGLLIERGD